MQLKDSKYIMSLLSKKFILITICQIKFNKSTVLSYLKLYNN